MTEYLPHIAIGVVSYLAGAIPFGFLVARSRGIDIRTVGSKNIGATNVFRSVGRGWGVLTFALDLFKGFAGAWFVPLLVVHFMASGTGAAVTDTMKLVGGIFAVVGHTWPVYIGFKGGKGVATSAGMLMAIAPAAVGIAFLTWVFIMAITRYVSVASIAAALALGILVWLPRFCPYLPSAITLTVLAAVVIIRHHANISRLAHGTESRFSFTKKQKELEMARRAKIAEAGAKK